MTGPAGEVTEVTAQGAGRTARQALAQTALLLDLVGRQAAVLRNTYPAWSIGRGPDADGRMWWVARLRLPYTEAMEAAGVQAAVRQPDAIALAATLAWQSGLLATAARPH